MRRGEPSMRRASGAGSPHHGHGPSVWAALAALTFVQCKPVLNSSRESPQASAVPALPPLATVGQPTTRLPDSVSLGAPEAWYRFDLPPPGSTDIVRTISLWATYYYLPEFTLKPGGTPLLNLSEQNLFGSDGLTLREWCDVALQGSVRLKLPSGQRQAVSYAGDSKLGRHDCAPWVSPDVATKIGDNRFERVNFVFGRSATQSEVIPFRTFAVDKSTIPHGTTLYIPSARGTSFVVDGRTLTHDGYFFAADAGSAIIGDHVDLFTGTTSYREGPANPFSFVTSSESRKTSAQVIRDSGASRFLREQHRYAGK